MRNYPRCQQLLSLAHLEMLKLTPNHEKKKTLPYMLNGFSTGTDLAFLLIGFTAGAFHSEVIAKPMVSTVTQAYTMNEGLGTRVAFAGLGAGSK